MSDERKNSDDGRKPYEAPKVTRVSLRPEEAVLGHCKIMGQAGPVSGSCGGALSCHSKGS